MKVLIISFHFPPTIAIGAARVAALSKALLSAGHDLRVVTAAAPDVADRRAADISPDRVDAVPWFDVTRLVMRRRADHPPRFAFDAPKSRSRNSQGWNLRRLVSAIYRRLVAVPDSSVGWIPFALRAARHRGRSWKPDIIFSSGPPFSAHIVASLTAKGTGVPWVADYRDPWTQSVYYPFGRFRRTLDRWIERLCLRHATALTATSLPIVNALGYWHNKPAHLVLNGYDTENYYEGPFPRLSNARLNILYVGSSFYEGRRSPALLFEAIHQMDVSEEDIRVHFLGTSRVEVMHVPYAQEVSKHLVFYPSTSRDIAILWQQRADVLLLLLQEGAEDAPFFPGKLFEYIGANRPVLLTGYSDGVAGQLLSSTGLGWVVPRLDLVIDALTAMSAGRAWPILDRPSERQRFDRASQTLRLRNLLEELSGSTI